MGLKSLIKGGVQRLVLSGPVYRALRARCLEQPAAEVPGARERLEAVSPRPRDIRPVAEPMPPACVDISVIVPVYNVERYLAACLDSVLSQDMDDGRSFEVVAVDDGSTDGSSAILDGYAARDRRLRVIRQGNRGLSGARNAGIAAARGRFLSFVDSDDDLAPGHLRNLLREMDRVDADVVSGLWQRTTEEGVSLGLGESRRMNMAPWGRLYRREVWRDLRFPEGCWYEDLITPCCIQPLFSEAFSRDDGYLYRIRPGSIVEESSTNPKALDSYWALEELLGWRGDLGITFSQGSLDRFMDIMGPTLMGRLTFLEMEDLRAVFALCCDLLASLDELRPLRTTRGGAWPDVERALRTRRFELWCLACAACAAESRDVKLMTAWSYYREAMGRG